VSTTVSMQALPLPRPVLRPSRQPLPRGGGSHCRCAPRASGSDSCGVVSVSQTCRRSAAQHGYVRARLPHGYVRARLATEARGVPACVHARAKCGGGGCRDEAGADEMLRDTMREVAQLAWLGLAAERTKSPASRTAPSPSKRRMCSRSPNGPTTCAPPTSRHSCATLYSQAGCGTSLQPGASVQSCCGRRRCQRCRRSAVAKRHGTHLGGWHLFTGWQAWVERMDEARAEQRLVTSSRATIAAFHLRKHLSRLKSATHGANICAWYPTQPCTPALATAGKLAR
jgi:hypothetical protein